MGSTPLDATWWPAAGHRLGRLVRDVLQAGHAFLVVSAASGRYVQLHAHPDGRCWVEADSGACSTRSPTGNYGCDVDVHVDVDALVLLLVRTLADGYDAAGWLGQPPTNVHVRDAFVAAAVARIRALRWSTRSSDTVWHLARSEGWIHLPPPGVHLHEIVAGARSGHRR